MTNPMQTAEARISASAFADTKPHYDILDGLRGVAALTVVCFHLFEAYATSHLDQRINHGYLAVDFFFILSGFVVGYAYDDRWRRMSVGEFLKRRLIRLQPMVVIGALIGAAMFYTQGCSVWDVSKVTVAALLAATLMNALMIPATPGVEIRGVGEMYPLNGPSWSLFFEYIGNILYAFFIRLLPTRALAVLAAVGAVLTVLLVTRVQNMDDHQSLAVAPFYLLGCFLCALLVSDLPWAWPRRILAVSAGAASCCRWFSPADFTADCTFTWTAPAMIYSRSPRSTPGCGKTAPAKTPPT